MTMFAQVQCPDFIPGDQLDRYLDRGWFRMGQTIFTTSFLNFKSQFYNAIWLRIPLDKFIPGTTQKKLFKRNSRFKIVIQKAEVTPEKEAIFSAYRQSVSFEASASVRTLLYGRSDKDIYNTQEVNLYDGDKLIAVGVFDVGKKSAAGISSFYDPSYKKFSLGKYLIYLKLEYCKKLGIEYFYPGYFVPGYPLFDYKLDVGGECLEFLEFSTQMWKPISGFSAEGSPLHVMTTKLETLQQCLSDLGVASKIMKYEFFDANLIPELEGIVLFDYPIFLSCNDLPEETPVVFDVRDNLFHWTRCKSVWASSTAGSHPDMYSTHVLKHDQDLFTTPSPSTLANIISDEIAVSRNFLRTKII